MNKEKRPLIARVHICCFDKFDETILKTDLNEYPDRLCIVDEENDMIIDVETKHRYTYVRTMSMLYFLNELERKKIKLGKRFGCFKYDNSLLKISSDELKQCREIINLLKQGFVFPDGNDELTNEEYLELINKSKTKEKKSEPSKIMIKKRKNEK